MTVPLPELIDRLAAGIEELASFNAAPELGGVTREVFTPEYAQAIDYVAGLMEEAGLETRTDAFGNLFGRWRGAEGLPVVMTGSHVDTTLNAGRYDGVVGVIGAIEAVRLLREEGFVPSRPIEVVAFAGEEPRFGIGCIGSRALIGALGRADLDRLRDRDEISLAEALRASGHDPDGIEKVPLDPAGIAAFVELHVEQGGVLEAAGRPIGVVREIAAPHDVRVRLTGTPMHSGATPMSLRRDPLVAASEAVLALDRLARASASGTTVGTVGVLRVDPCAVNVIPGQVAMEADVRDSDMDAREGVVSGWLHEVRAIAARYGLEMSSETTVRDIPRRCAPSIVGALTRASLEAGTEPLPMVSGAYHDAMIMAERVPAGMLFVPSADGLSHCPDEFTAPPDIALGVRVLGGALRQLSAGEER